MSRDAYQRFIESMQMNFDRWHDGEGFDLAALREMSREDLESIRVSLRCQDRTWREIEALDQIDALTGSEEVKATYETAKEPENRLKAAMLLFEQGKLDRGAYETLLCNEIRGLTTHDSFTTQVLLYAQGCNTPAVRQALLYASWNRTDAAFHCAGRLLYLADVAKDPLAWDYRPLCFDLQPNNSFFTREAAFKKLCELTGMTLEPS